MFCEKLGLRIKGKGKVTGKGIQNTGSSTQEYEQLNCMWLTEG